jgi:hypothetical protein
VLNFSTVKALSNTLHPYFARKAIFTSNRSFKGLYSPPTEALNFRAVKMGTNSYARFVLRILFGTVDIVHNKEFLLHAPSHSTGCVSICAASITTTVEDALTSAASPSLADMILFFRQYPLSGLNF